MRKTSVYLTEHEAEVLRRLAEDEGKSQAAVLREAILAYDEAHLASDQDFAIIAAGTSDGRSIADIPEEELMRGFGEDDRTPYMRRTFDE